MSHPVPGHDYSEQTKGESNKDYVKRRKNAMGKAIEKKKITRDEHIGKYGSLYSGKEIKNSNRRQNIK